MKKVLVSGCFDLLHAGHIAFLNEASTYGDLYVCVGSDANIKLLKNHPPLFSDKERAFVLNSLGSVKEARVARGSGILDFLPDIEEIKPDIFIVNEDGHNDAKRALCEKYGIEYHVLERIPAEDFPARSSSDAKERMGIPYRVCLAGGWLDQPWVSELSPGSVVVARLAPTKQFMHRAGMATSTRETAKELWSDRIPEKDPERIARLLFGAENPPGSKYISGSQDALGVCLPGVNRLDYSGEFWPRNIESTTDRDIAQWLERILHFIPIAPRPEGYDPLKKKCLSYEKVKRLGEAGILAWESILTRDSAGLGHALNETTLGWRSILPMTVDSDLMAIREQFSEHLGSCYSGCGGGYLMVISEKKVPNSIKLSIDLGAKESTT